MNSPGPSSERKSIWGLDTSLKYPFQKNYFFLIWIKSVKNNFRLGWIWPPPDLVDYPSVLLSNKGALLLKWVNPFNTSVLVCASQVKISKKNFFLTFLWKVPRNLILIWRIQKLNSFSHIFSSSSSFLLRLVKDNVSEMGQSFLFTDLHQNCHVT